MLNSNQITNLDSNQFLFKIKRRGYNLNQNLKNDLTSFEKYYRNNPTINVNQIVSDLRLDINEQNIKLIEIFKKHNISQLNYIDYIIILDSLDKQHIKNLNRYFVIKCNVFKIKNKDYDYFKFDNNLDKLSNYNEIYKQFIINIDNFLELFNINNKDQNIKINLHLLFVLNNLQDCLCPL